MNRINLYESTKENSIEQRFNAQKQRIINNIRERKTSDVHKINDINETYFHRVKSVF